MIFCVKTALKTFQSKQYFPKGFSGQILTKKYRTIALLIILNSFYMKFKKIENNVEGKTFFLKIISQNFIGFLAI